MFMKKWEKCYIALDMIIFVILCVGYIIFQHSISCFPKKAVDIIETIFFRSFFLITFAILVFGVIHVILFIKQGLDVSIN